MSEPESAPRPSSQPAPPRDAAMGAGDRRPEPAETLGPSGTQGSLATTQLQGSVEAWIGKTLGKYQITDLLGVGGMGVVLKAHDPVIERDVAIKILPPELASDPTALRRFQSEAKSAGKLAHPHAVTVYDVAQDGDVHFLAMELVAGGTTRERLERHGPFSVAEATRIVSEASRGLGAAHALGFVHRDVKPGNLLLTPEGATKVSDFGLAKRTEGSTMGATQAGRLVGTPFFMSPEQCESRPVDARSDVYSLGATYYTLLTGRNPYDENDSMLQVMYSHVRASPPNPRAVDPYLPAACTMIVRRAMAKRPAERYPTMEAMDADLQALLAASSGAEVQLPSGAAAPAEPRPRGASAPRRAALAALALGGLYFGVAWLRGKGDAPRDDAAPNAGTALVPAAPSGPALRVGVLHSLSGTMADSESPIVDAVLLAIDELNAAGGVLGRPVEAVIADGQSRDDVFLREARRLIDEEQAVTLFGCWTSSSRKTLVPLLEESDHLLLYPVQYEGLEESPNVVYLGGTPNQQLMPAVAWAHRTLGKRRFFLVGSDYVFPRVAAAIVGDQLASLGGELVGQAYVPLGSRDVAPAIRQIVEARPDVILNAINGDANRVFFTDLRAAGVDSEQIPVISFCMGEEELRRIDRGAAVGDYAAWCYFQSIKSPENEAFVAALQRKYGPQRVATDPMQSAYVGVKLWAQAATEAGEARPAAIRRALRNQRFRAPEGEVRIDAASQHTFKTPRIGRVVGAGQFEVIWAAEGPVAPQPYPPTRSSEQWHGLLHDLYRSWGNRWGS